jgi:RNA polymerase sigma-70 factor (ECF subfamily)
VERAIPFTLGSSSADNTNAEAALVVQAQAGQTAAFDSLMRLYRERVFGVVYNMTNNRADAAEVTQDVFIKAFTRLQKYNFRSSFFTWIYRIAVNEALNFLRKSRSKKASLFERILPRLGDHGRAETEEERLSSMGASPALMDLNAGTLRTELQGQLDKALQELSEEHRAVVVLIEIEGLSLKESTEILGVSEGTIKSRLHYAKKRLQSILKPYLNT